MDMTQQIKQEIKNNYLNDDRIQLVLYSGGKDSSFLLTLFWEVLLELPVHLRTKTVHVMTSDTGVEAPIMAEYVERTLKKIELNSKKQGLPIVVHRVKPSMKDNFFTRVLGRGNLISTPMTKHHPCTHWLKITPTQEKFKELIAAAPVRLGSDKTVLTAYMGVRNEESARRKASISKFQLSEESLWAKHSDFDEVMCFHPIKFITSDEVFFELLNRDILPYGISTEELSKQYGEGILECGVKTESEQGKSSCGASGGRLGCWTCGMVNGDDPMLLRFIAEGYAYEGLLQWKTMMLAMRNDIRYREVFPRQQYNRFFKSLDKPEQIDIFNTDESSKAINNFAVYKRAKYEEYAPGGMTFEGRIILLEHLLYIQERDGHSLITEDEIHAVLAAWEDTEGIKISREEIRPKPFVYDGQLAFLPNKTINKKITKTNNRVFYVPIELNKEETELYHFIKRRQKANQSSIFFFPDSQEYQDKKLVWNKATFVVCKEGITNEIEAAEYVYKWLGWVYGSFTEETKAAAINFLILSALSEGFKETEKKPLNATLQLESLPISLNKVGQLTFSI